MNDTLTIEEVMTGIGRAAKAAAAELAFAPAEAKAKALEAAADAVWAARAEIIAANGEDLKYGAEKGLTPALMDRLTLDEARIKGIVDSLRAIAAQKDPVGQVIAEWEQPSGLKIRRVRTPLGVIGRDLRKPPQCDGRCGRALPQGPAMR